MIPVLSVNNTRDAKKSLADCFGFSCRDGDMWLGSQAISVVGAGDLPEGFCPLRLDHVALSVDSADEICREMIGRGARYDKQFTPDGAREIQEFWDNGVRYVFFEGPEGAPIEFCEIKGGPKVINRFGHGHYAIRRQDFENAVSGLQTLGAIPMARHRLLSKETTVNVMFLSWKQSILEVFDEPDTQYNQLAGWIGVLG